MSSIKKKQEEKNLKILRELLTFENNRYCFDCNQRGPTYVNITIGSFVCTNCGGALRKYNHRVKSISMSNFNQTEMDFIKKRGNNICKKIYYGLCENNTPPEPDIKNGMLDSHLRSKYELKKWFQEPCPESEAEALACNQLIFDRVEKGPTKPVKTSYTVNSASNIIIDPPKQQSASKLGSSRGSRTSIDLSGTESTGSHTKSSNGVFLHDGSIDPSRLGGGSAVKLPGPVPDHKSHSWLTSTGDSNKAKSAASAATPSPFDDDFIFQTEKADMTNNFTAFPKSQTMNFSMPALVPIHPVTQGAHTPAVADPFNRDSRSTDKYAVLAELDQAFSGVHVSQQVASVFPSGGLDSISSNGARFSSAMPNAVPGWMGMSTGQFPDSHGPYGTVSNPFSHSLGPTQTQNPGQMTATFNPFISHNDSSQTSMSSHSMMTASLNWPGGSLGAPYAPVSGNPFTTSATSNEPVKSKNPFL